MTDCFRQPGALGGLRRVAGGVAEEARTRGFASPALAGFAFLDLSLGVEVEWLQFGNVLSVRFGSAAVILHQTKRPAGIRSEPAARLSSW